MALIVRSFLLSFVVLGRMALPTVCILLLSLVFWAIAGVFTLGLSGFFSGGITLGFLTLVGVRAALPVSQVGGPGQFRTLALYSVAYGVLLTIAKKATVAVAMVGALLIAGWGNGDIAMAWSFEAAEKSVQTMFALQSVYLYAVLSLALMVALPAALAVPMAAAARSAGAKSPDHRLLEGFGRSFLPLYAIFFVTYGLMFFFEIFAVLFLALPLLMAGALAAVLTFDFAAVQWNILLPGLGAGLALLWLHAWVWAASALALTKHEVVAKTPSPDPEFAAPDLRALRKARM